MKSSGQHCESKNDDDEMDKQSLASFGYHFDSNGVLLDKDGKKFQFTNEYEYNKIGRAVTEEIYRMMENPPYDMQKQYLDSTDKRKSAFIFVSKDWDQKENLVVLIHGSGAVRAGQWSRRLIINENLNIGSQLPYLTSCKARDWGVIVMNTNMNYCEGGSDSEVLKRSGNASEHGITVWGEYIPKAKAQSVAVVAHSAGGMVIASIMGRYWQEMWMRKLKCICLTDAIFRLPDVVKWMPSKIQNWIANDEYAKVGVPLDDKPLEIKLNYVSYVSAGTNRHEETSAKAMDDIIRYIGDSFAL